RARGQCWCSPSPTERRIVRGAPGVRRRSNVRTEAPPGMKGTASDGDYDSLSPVMTELRQRLSDINALNKARDVLSWDQHTHMPSAGARDRGQHMSVLQRLSHELFVDNRMGDLLALADEETAHLPGDHPAAQLLAVVGRDYRRNSKVPASFLERLSLHGSATFTAGNQARPADDFGMVADYLEKSVDLSREFSSFFTGAAHVADPQIDLVDEGFTVAALRPLFARLRAELVALLEAVGDARETGP